MEGPKRGEPSVGAESDAPRSAIDRNRQPDYDRLLHRHKGISGSEFAGIGLQFGLTIVLFALAGIWLDKRLGTSPWFVLMLVFAGAGLGFWSMVRRMTAGSGKLGRGRSEVGATRRDEAGDKR